MKNAQFCEALRRISKLENAQISMQTSRQADKSKQVKALSTSIASLRNNKKYFLSRKFIVFSCNHGIVDSSRSSLSQIDRKCRDVVM